MMTKQNARQLADAFFNPGTVHNQVVQILAREKNYVPENVIQQKLINEFGRTGLPAVGCRISEIPERSPVKISKVTIQMDGDDNRITITAYKID